MSVCADGGVRLFDIRRSDSVMAHAAAQSGCASVHMDEVKILVGTMTGQLLCVDPAACGSQSPTVLWEDPSSMPLYGVSCVGSTVVTGGGSGTLFVLRY